MCQALFGFWGYASKQNRQNSLSLLSRQTRKRSMSKNLVYLMNAKKK